MFLFFYLRVVALIMFVPTNEPLAYFFLVVSVVLFGSWTSIRSLCKADGPLFTLLNIFGQFVVTLTMCLVFGTVKLKSGSYFDERLFTTGEYCIYIIFFL